MWKIEEVRIENNKVKITGTIINDFQFSHEAHGEKFYTSLIASKRASAVNDYIPIIVSERLVNVNSDSWPLARVTIYGSFRSYRRYTKNGKHSISGVFVDEIACVESSKRDENEIHLDGYICKNPSYRVTPKGREISDILLAVNRTFKQSDYIHCIAWGRNARYASGLDVGTRIRMIGRIQSREYPKWLENGKKEIRIAYEVSAQEINVVEESEVEDESRDSE